MKKTIKQLIENEEGFLKNKSETLIIKKESENFLQVMKDNPDLANGFIDDNKVYREDGTEHELLWEWLIIQEVEEIVQEEIVQEEIVQEEIVQEEIVQEEIKLVKHKKPKLVEEVLEKELPKIKE